jgi:glutathione S-transferase
VPVLVDGDEVIHDSKRIVQYLDWKHGGQDPEGENSGDEPSEKAAA